MADELKWTYHKDHILVETEVVDFDKIKKKHMLHYIIEIHDTEADKKGVVTFTEKDGEVAIKKYESFSKARAHAVLMKQQDEWKHKKYEMKVVSVTDEE